MKHFCFSMKHSGFIARQNLFSLFPLAECRDIDMGMKIGKMGQCLSRPEIIAVNAILMKCFKIGKYGPFKHIVSIKSTIFYFLIAFASKSQHRM